MVTFPSSSKSVTWRMVTAVRLHETFERLAVNEVGNGTVANMGVRRKGSNGLIRSIFRIVKAVLLDVLVSHNLANFVKADPPSSQSMQEHHSQYSLALYLCVSTNAKSVLSSCLSEIAQSTSLKLERLQKQAGRYF